MPPRPRRGALYLPASNPRALAKARTLPCDIVILDLEDAVAPERKGEARAAAVAAIGEGGWGGRELLVRVNAPGTDWAADDLGALAGAAIDGVVLPKVASPDPLRAARALLGPGPALWAMIETPRGVLDLREIVAAAAETGLAGLIAGTNDLAKELRCRPGADRAPLVPALAAIVGAARAAGLVALDGVCNALADGPALAAECEQGRALGFDGKSLIHPAQIAAAIRAFGPSGEEIVWARRVVEAFAGNAALGAIRLDGAMVERLHLAEAERVLAMADQAGIAS